MALMEVAKGFNIVAVKGIQQGTVFAYKGCFGCGRACINSR